MPSIGEKIKFLRQRDGVTTLRLSQAVGVPKEDMQAIEKDEAKPTDDLTYRLAEFFKMPRDYFMEGGGGGKPDKPEQPAQILRDAGRAAEKKSAAEDAAPKLKPKGRGGALDFSGFRYFKEESAAAPESKGPAVAAANPVSRSGLLDAAPGRSAETAPVIEELPPELSKPQMPASEAAPPVEEPPPPPPPAEEPKPAGRVPPWSITGKPAAREEPEAEAAAEEAKPAKPPPWSVQGSVAPEKPREAEEAEAPKAAKPPPWSVKGSLPPEPAPEVPAVEDLPVPSPDLDFDEPAEAPPPPKARPAPEPRPVPKSTRPQEEPVGGKPMPAEKRLEPRVQPADISGARMDRGEVRLLVESRASDYVLALVEIFIEKGYFTREEFQEALEAVRERPAP